MRIAGVKVGSVVGERIDPKSFLAVVTLTVQDGLQLPKDSSAEIASDSLLGGKYVCAVARRRHRDAEAGPVDHHHPVFGQP